MGDEAADSFEITGMVEKPEPGTAPSNRFVSGRYILEPEIMGILEGQERGAGNEIQLTDAMLTLMQTRPFRGVTFEGRTFDCGAKLGFLEAQLHFGLRGQETGRRDAGGVERLRRVLRWRIEWDADKAQSNAAKHGVTFEAARLRSSRTPFIIRHRTDDRVTRDVGKPRG